MSKEHAIIQFNNKYNAYELKDLNSVNGSYVNNQKITTKILEDQD